jgi:hypothetical protein
MASTYSTNLKIELIGTGEQAGTWGTTTNTNLGTALEQAVVGKADVTMSSTTITLTLTNANTAQNARAIYLNLTGSPGGAAVLEVPAIQKPYIVKNGSDQQVTIKVSGQTGVAIPTGKTALVYNNGTDVVTAVDFIPEIATTTVDTTNIEVTNIKAKDGTSAGSIADSTGVVTLASSVLTTTDINGGTIDGAVIGGASAAAGSFTTLTATSDATINGVTVGEGAGSISTNTAVGANALDANTTGFENTAVGVNALTSNTTGIRNTAVGYDAVASNTTGERNSGFGQNTLFANTTGSFNTALGYDALQQNTTASNNTAVGYQALLVNTTGADNTAVGSNALDANTTGANNTAVGKDALTANTTGSANTALGNLSMISNTTANHNVGVGYFSLYNNTTGTQNVAVGSQALGANTTGADNTAVGYQALDACTTGEQNTAVGSFAGTNITTAVEVTAVGYAAMSASGTAATGSTAIGRAALNNVTGTLNTAIGHSSGNAITSGSKNTILGSYNGNAGGLDIRTASNHIVLSDGDGNPRQIIDSSGRVLINRTSSIGNYGQLLEIGEGSIDGVAGLATFSNLAIADDATLTLNANTGLVVFVNYFDGGQYRTAMFLFSYSGTGQLVSNDGGNFAVSDSDGDACLFKSGASDVVTVKNRLGSLSYFAITVMHLRGL